MSKQLHINASDDEVTYLLSQANGYTKGFRKVLRDHQAINDALKENGLDALSPRDLVGLIKCLVENGLDALSPRDLVGLIKCLVNDKKRLKTKMGA
jgi:hypothetical protein